MTSQRVSDLLAMLTLEEKAALTAGRDLWSTAPIERLGIPAVGLTDGPNGARGMGLPGVGVVASACTPCGAGLGASWDVGLIERVGALIGREARAKGCHVLLAPTVNIHRSPLGGRTFEAFSEDPLLSGQLAVAYIRGAQAQGVAATVKHFAGNENERERMTADSVIDERTLREIYLLPFEMAVRDGDVQAVMTAYNRLNGIWCGENAALLQILRQEWGFDGLVMTDWFGGIHTVTAMEAGLTLEMPGPGRGFGPAVAAAVEKADLEEAVVTESIRQLLETFEIAGVFDDVPAPAVDQPEDRLLLRQAAAASCVLLANDGALPLLPSALRSLAVIGPNAARTQIAGGGSAQVRPYRRASILDAIRDRLGGAVAVTYARGCSLDSSPPVCEGGQLKTPDGLPGLLVECFAGTQCAGDPVGRLVVSDTQVGFTDPPFEGLDPGAWSLRASGTFTPNEDGEHTWALSQAGRARLFVDGELIADGTVDPPGPGSHFFGLSSADIESTFAMTAGRSYPIAIELSSEGSVLVTGFRVGCLPVAAPDLMERAAAAASAADVAVVVVGTNDEWETEGHDRESLRLPGEQDELVRRVAAANPRTIVVVNTGSPVELPWADDVAAVLHGSFGGQEMGEGVVDVLTGASDPGGRLATTFPLRLEDTPAFTSFAPENHFVRYTEGVFVGYRWYDTRRIPVRFPFGHGLSYGTTQWSEPAASASTVIPGMPLEIELTVANTGERPATDVVQCYVEPLAAPVSRPRQELKAFAKVELAPGEQTTVRLSLDDRAFSYWHTGDDHAVVGEPVNDLAGLGGSMAEGIGTPSGRPRGWLMAAGEYDIVLARSSADPVHRLRVRVDPDRP
jgi:beta-glucosidase